MLLRRIGLDVVQEAEQALTRRALLGMAHVPGLKIFGIADPDSPAFARKGGVIPFDLKGLISHKVARELAARGGIGVRSGCHCAHLTVKRMIGIPPWAERIQGAILTVFHRMELPGVVRVSLGIENGADDVETLIAVLSGIARQGRAGAGGDSAPAKRRVAASSARDVQQQMDAFTRAAEQRVYA